jgi:hypothetical protein
LNLSIRRRIDLAKILNVKPKNGSETLTNQSKFKLIKWRSMSHSATSILIILWRHDEKIIEKHLNEIKRFRDLDNLHFRERLLYLFDKPDLETVYLNAFANVSHVLDEQIRITCIVCDFSSSRDIPNSTMPLANDFNFEF